MKKFDNPSLSWGDSLPYEQIDELIEDYLRRKRNGESLSIESFAQLHPSVAEHIRALFPTLLQMEQLGRSDDSNVLSAGSVSTLSIAARALASEAIGKRVGPYTLISVLGEGGFGVVYKVEQTEPMQRFLAMKIIKPEMDSREVLSRFNMERQNHSMLNHPYIAGIFDGGTSESGRPYFVMELVEGLSITQHCEAYGLSLQARVRLFVSLCEGVQHAHQRGIIHRDLKPSNILIGSIDDRLVPKIIDFGIAKALTSPLLGDERLTKYSQIVGTPLYMSPEQACFGATNIDTRSDIFSLGVILYELLTQTTPIDRERLSRMSPTELQGVISEEPAKRPRAIRGDISVDLETIVLKAIAKDPKDRYQSVGELADDLRLFLNDLPIRARRMGAVERTTRWCRRKPALASLLGSFVALGLGFVATTLVNNHRIRRETLAKSAALEAKSAALDEKNDAVARLEQSLAESERLKLLAFQRYYATQLNLAGQAWAAGEPTRADDLLRSVLPSENQPDIRGFEWYFLDTRLRQGLLRRMEIPGEEIIDLNFSPDGRRMVIVGGTFHSGFADVWDIEQGVKQARIYDDSDYVHGGVFSPDGTMIAIATGNGSLRVYDATDLQMVYSEKFAVSCRSLAWSPNHEFVVAGFEDGAIRVWKRPEFQHQAIIKGHRGPVLRLWFSSDGASLYSSADWGGEGRMSYRWNLDDGKLTQQASYPGYSVFDESPITNTVVAGHQGTVSILKNAKPIQERYLFSGSISNAKFSPSGESLFVGSRTERSIHELDSRTLEIVKIYPHQKSVQAIAMDPTNKRWAAGDAIGQVTLRQPIRLDDGVIVKQSPSRCVQWLDAVQSFVLYGGAEEWRIDAHNHKVVPSSSVEDRIPSSTRTTRLAAVSTDGSTRIRISQGTGQAKPMIWVERDAMDPRAIELESAVFQGCLAISRFGRWLAVRGEMQTARIFDLQSDTPVEVAAFDCQAYDLEFSPDEKRLVAAEQYGTVGCFDMEKLQPASKYSGVESLWVWGRVVAFSCDGRYVAVGGDSGEVRVWEVESQRLVDTLHGQAGAVSSLAFFPDNQRIAIGGDKDLRVWNFLLEQELLLLNTVTPRPISIAIDPSGNHIVAVLYDGTIQNWSAKSPLSNAVTGIR